MDNGDLRMVMQIRVFLAGSGTDQNSPDADPTKKVWIRNRTKKSGCGSDPVPACWLECWQDFNNSHTHTKKIKKYILNFANTFLLNFISFLFLQETSVYDKNWTKNPFFYTDQDQQQLRSKRQCHENIWLLSYKLLPYCRQKQYK